MKTTDSLGVAVKITQALSGVTSAGACVMNKDTAAPALPRLLTARDVSTMTGIPLARIFELVRQGDLPAIHLGRALRFRADAVLSFFDGGGTGPWSAGS